MEPALSLIPLLKQNIAGSSAGGFETCNLGVFIPPAYKLVRGIVSRIAVGCRSQTCDLLRNLPHRHNDLIPPVNKLVRGIVSQIAEVSVEFNTIFDQQFPELF